MNFLAAMFADGIVADEADRSLGPEVADEEAAQESGQLQTRPVGV
jgi:hypothetical protein